MRHQCEKSFQEGPAMPETYVCDFSQDFSTIISFQFLFSSECLYSLKCHASPGENKFFRFVHPKHLCIQTRLDCPREQNVRHGIGQFQTLSVIPETAEDLKKNLRRINLVEGFIWKSNSYHSCCLAFISNTSVATQITTAKETVAVLKSETDHSLTNERSGPGQTPYFT